MCFVKMFFLDSCYQVKDIVYDSEGQIHYAYLDKMSLFAEKSCYFATRHYFPL